MKRLLTSALIALLLCRPAPALADDDEKAVDALIKASVNSVMEILKDADLDKEAKKERVIEVVDPLFDLPLIAKLVMGRNQWGAMDERQRKEFEDLFVKQVRDSYFGKVDLLTDEKVEFEKPVRTKKKFTMLTRILSKNQRYEMLYKLHDDAGRWKVYDMEIEGISIVRSYRSQYEQFLQKSSIDDLLKKMKGKVLEPPKELKEKQDEIKAKAEKAEAEKTEKKRKKPSPEDGG
ncbi:MAG: ABC transporter substrate-binding protein [Elusimicrobiota bacterium]